MKIKDGWSMADGVSGLMIEARHGEFLNLLHIESLDGKMNRDFFFTHEGDCDGTGSACCGNIPDHDKEARP